MLRYSERVERLKAFLADCRAGKLPLGYAVNLPSPELVELAGISGFNWALLNQEHTLTTTVPSILPLARACEAAGLVYFVKLARWDPLLARDALDLGAYGIQVPFTTGRPDLERVFEALRFPPYGNRGICIVGRGTWYGAGTPEGHANLAEYLRFQNESALVIPTIENREGIEHLDEILEVPECPIIGLGPLDLGLSLGVGDEIVVGDGEAGAYLISVLATVAKKIRQAGKLVMMNLNLTIEHPLQDLGELIVDSEIDLPYCSDAIMAAFGMQMTRKMTDIAVETAAKGRPAPTESSPTDLARPRRVTGG